ncbi:tyrosine-type recombinase/integrase [Kribbella sp. NBC_01510]|uniref:tyrosine-type recombinase/integrase n=1 Tax=Kribbella sp. NBC_01510 TaxID=2903581 RepID=UPI00386D53C3
MAHASRLARPDTAPTKSRAGRRTIGLPAELTEILREHWKEQTAERALARQLWNEEGWVFAGPTGKPLSPNVDRREWKSLLTAAALRDGRLDDTRHTAATVLLLLGVPDRAVMDVMGWSSSTTVTRYQHITAPVRMDIAERVGGLIWAARQQALRTDRAGRSSRLEGVVETPVETLTDEGPVAPQGPALRSVSPSGARNHALTCGFLAPGEWRRIRDSNS